MPFFGTASILKDGRTIVPRFLGNGPGCVFITPENGEGTFQPIELINTIEEKNYCRLTAWFDRENLKTIVDMAEPGDLIEFERYRYCHFAVYLGASNSRTEKLGEAFVVHFSNLEDNHLNPIRIHVERLVDVQVTSRVRINNTTDLLHNESRQTLSLKGLVERIETFVNNHSCYSVLCNNCEHFATFCRYREKFSLQVAKLYQAPKDINAAHVVQITSVGGVTGYFGEGKSLVIYGLGCGAVFGLLLFFLFSAFQLGSFLYAKHSGQPWFKRLFLFVSCFLVLFISYYLSNYSRVHFEY